MTQIYPLSAKLTVGLRRTTLADIPAVHAIRVDNQEVSFCTETADQISTRVRDGISALAFVRYEGQETIIGEAGIASLHFPLGGGSRTLRDLVCAGLVFPPVVDKKYRDNAIGWMLLDVVCALFAIELLMNGGVLDGILTVLSRRARRFRASLKRNGVLLVDPACLEVAAPEPTRALRCATYRLYGRRVRQRAAVGIIDPRRLTAAAARLQAALGGRYLDPDHDVCYDASALEPSPTGTHIASIWRSHVGSLALSKLATMAALAIPTCPVHAPCANRTDLLACPIAKCSKEGCLRAVESDTAE